MTFDRTLRLDTGNGTPSLTLTIGNGTGEAACALATDTKKLECTYTVAGDDEDTDGVSIGANPLALNGGRIHGIHGATGGDAEPTHAALGSDDSHKVDGVRPTPANASVNGIALTLEWSETLDTGSAPAAGQFVLGVDSGTAPTVSSLTMSGTTMTLTLASAADATRDYTLAYTVPSSKPRQGPRGQRGRGVHRHRNRDRPDHLVVHADLSAERRRRQPPGRRRRCDRDGNGVHHQRRDHHGRTDGEAPMGTARTSGATANRGGS